MTGEAMRFCQPVTPDFCKIIANVKAGLPADYGAVKPESETVGDDFGDEFDDAEIS